MSSITATGSAGAGMVELTINGEYQVKSLTINDAIVGDKTTLEVLIVSAFNDATQKMKLALEDFAKHQATQMGFPQ